MPAPVQSHLDNFDVDITLGLLPSSGLSLRFSDVLIVTTTTESPSLGSIAGAVTIGNASKLVTGYSIQDGTTNLGANLKVVVQNFFGAPIHPDTVKIVAIDGTDTVEEIAEILEGTHDTIVRTPESFHSVISVSITQSDIASYVTQFNASGFRSHPVFAGLDDTDADANGIPDAAETAGISTLTALSAALQEQLYVTYHDKNGLTVSGAADFAEICAIYAATDWDNLAAGGNLVLRNTPELGVVSNVVKTGLDDNNINHALPSYGTKVYVDKGVMLGGRPVYHIFTRDWLENRLQLAVAEVKTSYANRRTKLPMDSTGQAVVLAAIKAVIGNGIRAQHLLSPEEAVALGKDAPYERALPITTTGTDPDLTARRLRFDVLAYFLEDARTIKIEAFVTT